MEDQDNILTIKRIKEAEEKAKAEIEKAKGSAEGRIKKAEEEAAKSISKEREKLNSDFGEEIKKISLKRKAILEKAAADGNERASKLVIPKRETAIKFFVDAMKARFKV
ncbi:MAG: hypothetical protein ACP5MT_02350 [Candidatus Acidifodinimicrobium sp.]